MVHVAPRVEPVAKRALTLTRPCARRLRWRTMCEADGWRHVAKRPPTSRSASVPRRLPVRRRTIVPPMARTRGARRREDNLAAQRPASMVVLRGTDIDSSSGKRRDMPGSRTSSRQLTGRTRASPRRARPPASARSHRSRPILRTSTSSTTATSLPAPHPIASRTPSRARTASSPAPPNSMSRPAPPSIRSSPAPPSSRFTAASPTSVSFPAPPRTFSTC
jgi:hypothetical protein